MKLRRAKAEDVDFLVELLTHEEVEPYLSGISAKDREAIAAAIERSEQEPDRYGQFIVEVDGVPAGTLRFESLGGPSKIASCGGLAIHPDFRGKKLGDDAAREFQRHLFDDLGFHRLQMEIYGFNERSMAHAERVGWVREGVKRKAYWRHGDWADGVCYGLLAEDLD